MYAAVAQLAVVKACLLGALACQLRYACHGFALALAALYLLLYHTGNVKVAVQVVVNLGLYEVTHVFVDRHAVGRHVQRTQFYLRL